MSRTALKKELSTLTAPQLVEVILDAYAARKEIRDYFEYYLNPDVSKLMDKYLKIVIREFGKSKYRHSKARTSVVKKALKDFTSYSPGDDAEIKALQHTVDVMAAAEWKYNFSDSQWNLVNFIAHKLLEIADRGCRFDVTFAALSHIASPERHLASSRFRDCIIEAIEEYNSLKRSINN